MDSAIPKEFLDYVRSYPSAMETAFEAETRRLVADPHVQQWLEQNRPQATPQQRMQLVQQQAAQNARVIATTQMKQMRQKYGVATLTPDTLQAAIQADREAYQPDEKTKALAAAAGKNAIEDYRQNVMPHEVMGEFQRLSPYIEFDQPPQSKTTKPAKAVEQANQPEGEPATPRPAKGDPVMTDIMQTMLRAGRQSNANVQAQAQPPAPLEEGV